MRPFRKPWIAVLIALGAGLVVYATPAMAAATRPLLSRPDLFSLLASTKEVEAYRLGAAWAEACDSMPNRARSPFDCLETIAEIKPRSSQGFSSLIQVISRCTWVRYKGGGLHGIPTLGFHVGGDSLNVDLVVWLDRRKASLSRFHEGWYVADIPESVITDVVWCLWGVDPDHPDLSSRVSAEMHRRGLTYKNAPPPDVTLVSDMRFSEPDSGEDGFVYYEDAPTPITQFRPIYPEMAREAKVEGRVVLHVLVGRDGRVKNIKVIRSVTMLDQAAVDAVRKWVFKPALSNNKPVAVWVEVPVEFPPK